MNHPTKNPMGENCTSQGDCLNGVHSDQVVLGTVRQEAGPRERQQKAIETKLARGGGGTSSLSPLRSDSSRDGQVGGWTVLTVAKGAQRESWKTALGAMEPSQKQA